jgi:hypothetical protein
MVEVSEHYVWGTAEEKEWSGCGEVDRTSEVELEEL